MRQFEVSLHDRVDPNFSLRPRKGHAEWYVPRSTQFAVTPRRACNVTAQLSGPSHAKRGDQPLRGFGAAEIARDGERDRDVTQPFTLKAILRGSWT